MRDLCPLPSIEFDCIPTLGASRSPHRVPRVPRVLSSPGHKNPSDTILTSSVTRLIFIQSNGKKKGIQSRCETRRGAVPADGRNGHKPTLTEMTLESALSNSVPASFRKSALFSRFTSPLATRNRHVTDFHVQPDDPWKSYGPGEVVKGCVVLTVIKPLPLTHLVVCLHGSARVHKNQVVPSENSTSGFLGPGRGRRGLEYLGNGFASLFEDETVLCGEGLLKKGIYKFQFELRFPSHRLPSSIDVSIPSTML